MRFSVDWIDGGLNRAAEERATLCDLRIYVSDQNACRFVDFVSNEDTEALIVPAVHLAEGLASDWWLLFGGRDREHRIQRYRTGFALPDLSFRADGSTFEVTGKSFYSENPHLRFPFAGDETLPRGAAEATLSGFIEDVVDRLAGDGVRNSEVAACWSRVAESRSDPDERAFCEASGALGLDPYAISEDDARFIEQADKLFSNEPLIEFLAGVRGRARSYAVAHHVGQVEARPAAQSSLPELGAVAGQVEHVIRYHRDDRPWAMGYRAARAFRDALGIGSDQRLASHAILAGKLGGATFEPAKLFSGVRALVSRSDGGTRIHLHDHQRISRSADAGARSNNFAFARAVGDAVCFRDTRRSVINDLHHAERQATGRAFAAEFLAPVESVVDMFEDGYDAEDIADEFDVSSYVIEDQIRNQNRIRGRAIRSTERPAAGRFVRRRRGLLVTDLDGTLLGGDRRLRDCDRAALERLGREGCRRAIATGRHLHSFGMVAGERFPVDYVVVSSGAGIYDVRQRRLVRSRSLTSVETEGAVRVLDALDLDFMVHRPIPDNHHFQYRWSGRPNVDFEGRMERYRAFATPLDGQFGPSAQLLAVVPAGRSEPSSEDVARLLPDLTVIRTTSPLDHRSTWIEVFPREVSKSQAAAWLAARHGIRRGDVCAVGNDYNDRDLLEWAGASYVVANAPPELRARHDVVAAGGHCGVAEAINRWRSS